MFYEKDEVLYYFDKSIDDDYILWEKTKITILKCESKKRILFSRTEILKRIKFILELIYLFLR